MTEPKQEIDTNIELSDSDLDSVHGGGDGITRLIAVTQLKSNNANDESIVAPPPPPRPPGPSTTSTAPPRPQ